MKKIFFSIALLFVTMLSFAKTYYISPSGNNANAGTLASPWKTLFYACETSQSGDIIHVIAGTYIENSTCQLKNAVSIEGDGKTVCIIKAAVSSGGEFLTLSSPQNTNGIQSISRVTIDGQYQSESNKGAGYGIWVTGRSNVSIRDVQVINFYYCGIIFDGFDATSPMTDPGVTATGNGIYNSFIDNCSTLQYNTPNGTYGNGCVMIGGQTGLVIDSCIIGTTKRATFKNGWAIKYWDNGWLKGCKITNSILTKPPYQANGWGQNGDWDFVIELFNIQGLEVAGNDIQGALDLNYNYTGGYANSVWIHNNTFDHVVPNYSHPESGVILEFATQSALIENNKFNNCFVGISYNLRKPTENGGYPSNCPTGNCSQVTNNIIRNNLFTNLYQAPYGTSGGIITQLENNTNNPYITGMQIYNNTFVAKATQAAPTGLDFTSQSSGTVTGITIKDNVFRGFPGGSVVGNKAQVQSAISVTNNDAWQTALPVWASGNVTLNFSSNPNFDGSWNNTLGIGYKSGAAPPPPNPCTSFVYAQWVCNNGLETRSYSALPGGCVGAPPADSLSRPCALPPANEPPVVMVGPDIFIKESFALLAEATDDGVIVSYKWTKLSGPSCVIVTPNANETEVLYSNKGTYVFQIAVKDDKNATTKKTVTVVIQ